MFSFDVWLIYSALGPNIGIPHATRYGKRPKNIGQTLNKLQHPIGHTQGCVTGRLWSTLHKTLSKLHKFISQRYPIPQPKVITMTSYWVRWGFKSPASRLFTQSFIHTQIKENVKAPRYWPLCGEFTGDRWIPRTNGQLRGKCFHLMTSSSEQQIAPCQQAKIFR